LFSISLSHELRNQRRRSVPWALRRILACAAPFAVLLFVSRPAGRARPGSELDLIVVADVGHRQPFLERELRERLGTLGIAITVLVRTPAGVAAPGATSFCGSVVPTARVTYDQRLAPNEESARRLDRQRLLEASDALYDVTTSPMPTRNT
jgi:hypothetical protein